MSKSLSVDIWQGDLVEYIRQMNLWRHKKNKNTEVD